MNLILMFLGMQYLYSHRAAVASIWFLFLSFPFALFRRYGRVIFKAISIGKSALLSLQWQTELERAGAAVGAL